jgi:hypothetical protein
MHTLTSQAELEHLLADRPRRTQTYRVPRDLLASIPNDSPPTLRKLSDSEIEELAEYLDVAADQLDGPFFVVDHTCKKCGHKLGFLDFVKTAVNTGHHDRAELRDVLTGRGRSWITIRGRDGGRPVSCASCGELIVSIRSEGADYSEYSNNNYAYA